MRGPDHFASDDPKQFNFYVKNIRKTEQILGSPIKSIQKEEREMKKVSRKGVYYNSNIKKGKKITLKDLIFLRPYNGLYPSQIKKFLNKKIRKGVKKFEYVKKNDFK